MTNDSRPGFCTVSDYLSLPHDPNTWLIKNLIPLSGAALVFGLPKTGKSSIVIQLAAAISGESNSWMGFPVVTHGRVLYLQLDTPRSTWRLRFDALRKHGMKLDDNMIMLADRECLNYYPFDILKMTPQDHMLYLHSLVEPLNPVAVIVDTLRKVHSSDEDSSTNMSNVVSRLIGAVHPAALILVSHSRKPNPEAVHDLMADHRGSGAVTGEMDAVMKLTKSRLYYGGRSIEEGDIKLERQDSDGVLLWSVRHDDINVEQQLAKVMVDASLTTMRAKARALAPLISKSEEAAMSIVRRTMAAMQAKPADPKVDTGTSLVDATSSSHET